MIQLIEFVDFVNSQAEFHERQAVRFFQDTRRLELHRNTAKKFRDLAEAIEFNEKVLSKLGPLPSPKKAALTLSWNEIEGLPDELVAELSISDSDKSDYNLIALIDEVGGMASLDRLLVELYKKTGEVIKRSNLNARLYRMIQKEMVFSVPGKKGVYSSRPINEEGDGDLS